MPSPASRAGKEGGKEALQRCEPIDKEEWHRTCHAGDAVAAARCSAPLAQFLSCPA